MSAPSDTRKRKFSVTAMVVATIVLLLLLFGMIYHFFLKDEVISVSGAKISELINMDVSFDGYEFIDGASLEITGLVIKSPYAKEDYREVNARHTDWIIAKISRIRLDNFDYERLIDDHECSASKITIDSAWVEVYRDKTLPEPLFIYKALPASLLRMIEGSVNVDTLIMNNIFIQYEERTKHATEPGKITFQNLSAECYHLTNDSARLAANPYFTIHASTQVLEKAVIKADIRFDLSSENDEFTMTAEGGSFDASILNSVIVGVLPAKITDGEVKRMQIEMTANDDRATGNMEFEYADMKFDLLTNDDSKFKSWLATAAGRTIIRKDNLSTQNNYRSGEIAFDRRKDRFIFNYWWNSLKSGIVDVMVSDTGKMINLDEKAKETN